MSSEFKWLAIIMIVSIGGIGLFGWWLRGNPQGESFPIEGREHIAEGQAHAPYRTNPPTSGTHYGQPAEWGVYDKELSDEQVVHNLEHGGIWISYKDMNEEELKTLKKIARTYPQSVIMTPRAKNDSRIALASWGRLQKLETVDVEQIRSFIKNNRNHSPEPLAR